MTDFGRALWEVGVIILIIALSAALVTTTCIYQRKVDRQQQLYQELLEMRSACLLYKSLTRHNPRNLTTLLQSRYRATGEGDWRPYVQRPPRIVDDVPIDPFGTPYGYDAERCWIMSLTPGFETR